MKNILIRTLFSMCLYWTVCSIYAQTPHSKANIDIDYSESIRNFYMQYVNCEPSREALNNLLLNNCTDQMRKEHLDVIFSADYDFLTGGAVFEEEMMKNTIKVAKTEDFYTFSFSGHTWPKKELFKDSVFVYLDETGKIAYVVRPSDGYIFPEPTEVMYNGILYSVLDSCSVEIKECTLANVSAIPDAIIINDVKHYVTSISDSAFVNCTSLTSVTIPGSVQKPGMYVFRGCKNLVSATLQNGIPYIDTGMFCDCEKLTSVSIPERVTHIWSLAFDGCKSLATLTLPSGLKKMEGTVFRNCPSLKTITCLATMPPAMRADGTTFNGFDRSQCTLIVPKGCAAKYQAATGWKEFKEIREL